MANSISTGVAYKDPAIVGGTVDNTPVGATTPSTGAFTTLSSTGDTSIGNAATDLIGFHGATAVDQAAVKATVTVSNTITVLVDAVNAILDLLKEKGLMASS